MASRIFGALVALSLAASTAQADAFRPSVTGIPLLMAVSQGATCIGPDRAVSTKHGSVPYETLATSPRYDLRLVRLPGCRTPETATVAQGDPVMAYGADAFGATEIVHTTVLKARWGVCEPVYIPEVHTVEGPCTREGKGYSYGIWLDAGGHRSDMAPGGQEGTQEGPWVGGIRPGFSGGAITTPGGELVGITAYGLVDSDGRHFAWAYPIKTVLDEFATELASR